MIRIFVTGGTFDKTYDEISGRLSFDDTHLHEMLQLGRSRVETTVETLMMIDSLDMTDADRTRIVESCARCPETRIVITHGTDTMVETARALWQRVSAIRPSSSLGPWSRTRSAAPTDCSISGARCHSRRCCRQASTSR